MLARMYEVVLPKLMHAPTSSKADAVLVWMGRVRAVLDAERCTMFLCDDESGTLVTYAEVDDGNEEAVEVAMDTGPSDPGGIAVACASQEKVLNFTDKAGTSLIAAPFYAPAGGQLLGVCELMSKPGREGFVFGGDEEGVLHSLLRMVALEVEGRDLKVALAELLLQKVQRDKQ